ncbi:MAG TPA: D-alanyl-D-alanine carboxypeptidase family protein [Spirochaetia bacterium]|nr:D-alanyl-D-alanine carboxypeptidase family protein [Spirochaetia bacterium]
MRAPLPGPAGIVLLCLLTAPAGAAAPASQPALGVPPAEAAPVLTAKSAILLEAVTGTVLYEKHADEPIPPASLTKLMTIHLALREIEEGRLDPSEVLVPGPDAWAKNMPPRSSVMYLGPDQKLTVEELLKGLVVDSGNDAAVEVADRVAGSVPRFVDMMNREAARLGYRTLHFVEPAGISAANTVTARDYAGFARQFVLLHPDALKEFFSVKEFTYPLAENLTGTNREKAVTQTNRNLLLGAYAGVDGLKTGFIDESGYNIAVTAERGGMRLIAVLLGVPDTGRVSGAARRATESAALLDYGYDTFLLMRPGYPRPLPPRVWKGTARTVALRVSPTPFVVVRKDQAGQVKTTLLQDLDVEAPVSPGEDLGAVLVTRGSQEIARFPLVADAEVRRGGFLRTALDSVILFLRGIRPLRSGV